MMINKLTSGLRLSVFLTGIATAICNTALAAPAVATTAAPTHIESEVAQARLAGQGSFRWFGIKIYDAQLWVGAAGYRTQSSERAKVALDLQYARELPGEKIAEASEDEMRKLNRGTAEQRASWQAAMEKIFPDVKDGTHLTGILLPGEGARFYMNGKYVGEIMDAEFALAFFAIWLDPKTSAPNLREALLANAAPR